MDPKDNRDDDLVDEVDFVENGGPPIDDEMLIDYALGELDPKDAARVELLLAEHPELMREARALKRMVSHMGVSMVMPPPRLVSRTRHAAYEATAGRRGWRGLLWAALRRPVTAAAAGLVAVVLVIALVGPSLWSPTGPTSIGSPAELPESLRVFFEKNLVYMKALSRGERPDVEDYSVEAGKAMLLAEEKGVDSAQLLLLQDIEGVWRVGYERANSGRVRSEAIIAELKGMVQDKKLVERLEAQLAGPGSGR
jgi:hypothetical protein